MSAMGSLYRTFIISNLTSAFVTAVFVLVLWNEQLPAQKTHRFLFQSFSSNRFGYRLFGEDSSDQKRYLLEACENSCFCGPTIGNIDFSSTMIGLNRFRVEIGRVGSLTISETELTFTTLTNNGFTAPIEVNKGETITSVSAIEMAKFIVGQLRAGIVLQQENYRNQGRRQLDSPGCDIIPDVKCNIGCCAQHDQCFDEVGCTALSWLRNLCEAQLTGGLIGVVSLGPLGVANCVASLSLIPPECSACNWKAAACIGKNCAGSEMLEESCYDNICKTFYTCPGTCPSFSLSDNSAECCSCRKAGETCDNNARCTGDPHLLTFDGLAYDCQAKGEVILVTSSDSNFQVQARFAEVSPGIFPTVTTGVAVRNGGTPVLQVSFSDEGETQFFVGGIKFPLASGDEFLVTIEPAGTIILQLGEGLKVALTPLVYRDKRYFNVFISMSGSFRSSETIFGLLGSPNLDSSDDWMSRNGTPIPIPQDQSSRLYQSAYDYCTTTWCVRNATESLFTYNKDSSFSDFACDSSRTYDPSTQNAVQNAPQCLRDICGENQECLIDGIVAGRAMADGNTVKNPLEDCKPNTKACYFSCEDALTQTCDQTSGVVPICPSISGDEIVEVYCDQVSDGGGWMLLYSYNHRAGNSDSLQGNTIPINPNDSYSHFLLNSLPGYLVTDVESVRFYCTTTGHDRVIHFKSDHPYITSVAFDGNRAIGRNSNAVWNDEVCYTVPLEGHTANLPGSININHFTTAFDLPDAGFHLFPFWRGELHHWAIRSVHFASPRFECDDYLGNGPPGFQSTDTLHNVWVKMRRQSTR